MRPTASIPLCCLVVLLAFPVGTAAADSASAVPMKQDARSHLDEGSRFFRIQEYEKAIAEFKAGYLADPQPVFLYALGQAERLGGRCEEAIVSYRQFLEVVPPPETDEAAAGIRNAKEMMQRCEEALKEQAAPPVSPSPSPPSTTAGASSPSPPGPSTVSMTPPGASAGVAARPVWYADAIGDGLALTGAAALAASAVFFSLGNASALDAQHAPDAASYTSDRRAVNDDRTMGLAAAAAGGALAAAAALRYWLRSAGPARTTVAASAVPGGVALWVTSTWP